ncbi:hypothetical protein ACFE04_020594 [Oxalis oulophora]
MELVDQIDNNPSQINSFQENKPLHIGMIDLNRKRKLQAEQLGLPLSKHKCSYKSVLSKPLVLFTQDADMHSEKSDKGIVDDDGSESESSKGSNSFIDDVDISMSEYWEDNLEIEKAKPSSSRTKDGLAFVGEDPDPLCECSELQASANLQEPILAFESHFDYIYSQLDSGCSEQFSEKEVDDVFFSSEGNPNIYVLSSGRWDVDQGKCV